MARQIQRAGIQQGFDVRGDKEIAEFLRTIQPKFANSLLRSTNFAVAGEIAKKAKANAKENGLQTVSRAIKAKRKKSPPDKPVSTVYVQHGGGAKDDAWYWHFHEFGTVVRYRKDGVSLGRISEKRFIGRAFDAVMADMRNILREKFTKQLQKKVRSEQKKVVFSL
jgi:HK97 gp10 family phage protein